MHWLTISWWRYLIWGGEVRTGRDGRTCDKPRRVESLRHFLCRARGHPEGVVWFNAGGYEPDMHCRECGDDLG